DGLPLESGPSPRTQAGQVHMQRDWFPHPPTQSRIVSLLPSVIPTGLPENARKRLGRKRSPFTPGSASFREGKGEPAIWPARPVGRSSAPLLESAIFPQSRLSFRQRAEHRHYRQKKRFDRTIAH